VAPPFGKERGHSCLKTAQHDTRTQSPNQRQLKRTVLFWNIVSSERLLHEDTILHQHHLMRNHVLPFSKVSFEEQEPPYYVNRMHRGYSSCTPIDPAASPHSKIQPKKGLVTRLPRFSVPNVCTSRIYPSRGRNTMMGQGAGKYR
jgi:hypothetical protein